jgi:hypothetical protein
MTKQASFSELEYAAKKKQTRRDRFLAEIEAVTPWGELERTITPPLPEIRWAGQPAHWAYPDAAHVRGTAMLRTLR